MASVAFPMEDQTDEDFFDKLVDDGAGSEPSIVENDDTNDIPAFGKLSINEFGATSDGLVSMGSIEEEVGGKGNDSLSENEGKEYNVGGGDSGGGDGGAESSELVDSKRDSEFGDNHLVGSVDASGLVSSNSSLNAGGGIKEVQWSAFGRSAGEASDWDFFDEIGDKSDDPFREAVGGVPGASDTAYRESANQVTCSASYDSVQKEDNLQHGVSTDHNTQMLEQSSSQYWENLYPGWKYDSNTGQWYQLDDPDTRVNSGENYNACAQSTSEGVDADSKSDVYCLQQTAQSAVGSFTEESKTSTVSYWNQATQGSTEYPAHLVFDPQYPGWYYDTISQEWKPLEAYIPSINQSTSLDQNQQMSNGTYNAGSYFYEPISSYNQGEKVISSCNHDQMMNRRGFDNNNHQQVSSMVQPEPFGKNEAMGSTQHTYFGNGFMASGQNNYSADLRAGVMSSRGFDSRVGSNGFQNYSNGVAGYHNISSAEIYPQHNNQQNMEFGGKLNYSVQSLHNNGQSSYANERSTAGRPPHALVAFGFGGKLIVMKDQNTLLSQSSYMSQDFAGGVINVLNMMEVALLKSDGADMGFGPCDYFRTVCQQSLPGPLASGHAGSKELNKWIDDRIANCGTPNTDNRKDQALKMLFSLLKIACQYYGKLRSSFVSDIGLKEHDCPESAVAKLFASAKKTDKQCGATTHCLQNMPSEGQLKATADEVQMLLVSGRRMEALQCAQEGHLWGPAIIIAALLGEQFYGETVKQMALHQLVVGSPLRTLCLLLAGQPAEVFSNLVNINPPNGLNASQPVQAGPSCMLDEWEENLAIITANRTKGDELVITHLGDCLWKERGEVIAAHICYLIAEANIESYSESARLCLIGADHLNYPRTYASAEAIQRTELYEYSKVLGNSQYILLPFQPYKIIYASMLAEIGKLSDSLKYCQSALKSLKAGRSSEVDAWRHAATSLEDRIKLHLQGGYATNLAPAKLVGKLLNFFDNTAHRVVGGLPPPIPSTSHNGRNGEYDHQLKAPRVSMSQSTMAISSLMPSGSTEGSTHKSFHNRSISEPDMGRTPRKVESPDSNSSAPDASTSGSGGSSRIGRFGSQIFQKTFGLVLRSHPDRQAKLGEKNKFYYDEKLKRWVEEGAELPAEEPALAPPPVTAAFMNGKPDHEKKSGFVNGSLHANGEPDFNNSNHSENGAGAPPIPFASNQFSAHGRMGVRARYVDTFNKGGGYQANVFKSPSPSVPTAKPPIGNAKFFIPTPVTGRQETGSTPNPQEADVTNEGITSSNLNQSFSSPQMHTPQPTTTIHRHPSMEHIPSTESGGMMNGNGPAPPHSRRTLSWSGGVLGDPLSHGNRMGEARPLGEALGFPPSTYMPDSAKAVSFSSNCSTVTEDLQEVEL